MVHARSWSKKCVRRARLIKGGASWALYSWSITSSILVGENYHLKLPYFFFRERLQFKVGSNNGKKREKTPGLIPGWVVSIVPLIKLSQGID